MFKHARKIERGILTISCLGFPIIAAFLPYGYIIAVGTFICGMNILIFGGAMDEQ